MAQIECDHKWGEVTVVQEVGDIRSWFCTRCGRAMTRSWSEEDAAKVVAAMKEVRG